MSANVKRSGVLLALGALTLLLFVGCGQSPSSKSQGENDGAKPDKKAEHQHGEWWCVEHGIPEHECSMCSADYAAKCKAKGDWCEKHDRAQSQCFLCDPKLKEKYAAKYRAKYGKEPPATEDEAPRDKE